MLKNSITQLVSQKRSFGIFFAILLYYGLTRLSLIFRFGDVAFGYDTGIYRRIILDHSSAMALSDNPPFAFGTIARIFSKLHFSIDAIMYSGYIAIGLGILVLLYTVVKKYTNIQVALISAFIFATSTMHFDFFGWYYYRNIIAIFCFFVSIYLIQKKSHFISIPLILLASIHPLSAIPMFLSLGIYGLIKKEYRVFLLSHLLMGTVITLLINVKEFTRYIELFLQYSGRVTKTPTIIGNELDGQFITLRAYMRASLVYLPFGVIGIWKFGKKHLLFSIFFFVNALLIFLQLLLYKRFFVLLDLSIVFFAGLYLSHLVSFLNEEKWKYIPILIFSLYLIIPSVLHVQNTEPIIYPRTLESIQQIDHIIPPQSTLLVVSTIHAPWVLGFTNNHTIIAPGMFDNNLWNEEKWHIFRSTINITERHQLLDVYKAESLYIFATNSNLSELFVDDPNISQLSDSLWMYQKTKNHQ